MGNGEMMVHRQILGIAVALLATGLGAIVMTMAGDLFVKRHPGDVKFGVALVPLSLSFFVAAVWALYAFGVMG